MDNSIENNTHCQGISLLLCVWILNLISSFHSHTGVRARLQSVPSYSFLLPWLARPWSSTICHLSPRLPEAGPQEPSHIRAPSPGPLQCWGRAYRYVHCTGCYAPVHPGGESGECVPVCAGTAGETISNGPNHGELGWRDYSSCGQLSSIYAQRHQRHPSTNTNKK